MQQLLADPETINFRKGKNISLGLLKKEIDRRIIKIKGMLGQPNTTTSGKAISKTSCQCQTDNIMLKTAQESLQSIRSSITPKKKALQISTFNHAKVEGSKRSSLPVQKSTHKKQSSEINSSYKDKTKLSQYLQACKSGDKLSLNEKNHHIYEDQLEESNEKRFTQNNNDDKHFYCQDVRYRSFQFDRFVEHYGRNRKLSLNFDESEDDEQNKASDIDTSNSFIGRKRLSTLGFHLRSGQKNNNKFTDRTAAETQKRIVISEDCQMRMIDVVSQFQSKSRREGKDSTIRNNIIRKIDQRYGCYYDDL